MFSGVLTGFSRLLPVLCPVSGATESTRNVQTPSAASSFDIRDFPPPPPLRDLDSLEEENDLPPSHFTVEDSDQLPPSHFTVEDQNDDDFAMAASSTAQGRDATNAGSPPQNYSEVVQGNQGTAGANVSVGREGTFPSYSTVMRRGIGRGRTPDDRPDHGVGGTANLDDEIVNNMEAHQLQRREIYHGAASMNDAAREDILRVLRDEIKTQIQSIAAGANEHFVTKRHVIRSLLADGEDADNECGLEFDNLVLKSELTTLASDIVQLAEMSLLSKKLGNTGSKEILKEVVGIIKKFSVDLGAATPLVFSEILESLVPGLGEMARRLSVLAASEHPCLTEVVKILTLSSINYSSEDRRRRAQEAAGG